MPPEAPKTSNPPVSEQQPAEAATRKASAPQGQPNAAGKLSVMQVSRWEGPIPPPEILRAINDVAPNGADRIIKQFESETAHRHKLESRRQLYPFIDQLIARLAALVFAAGALGVVVYAISRDAQWVATVIGGAMIIHGINAFLRNRKN